MIEKQDSKTIRKVQLTSTDPADIEKVITGMDKLAGIIAVTLGPYGRNVLIQKKIKAMTTKDGFTVARFAVDEDVMVNLGMAMLREICFAMNFQVGDGTTTAGLIGHALIRKGLELIKSGKNPVLLARQIRKDADEIIANIDKLKREFTTNDDIKHIATVSSGYDEIGQIIADIYKEKGLGSRILVQRAMTDKTEVEHVQGLKIDRTYISPAFVNDKNKAIFENAAVLIIDKEYVVVQEFIRAVEQIVKGSQRKELVIFARHLPDDCMRFLLQNKQEGNLKSVVIDLPGNWQDIELLTGAEAISEKSTRNLKDFRAATYVGTAKRVECNAKYTTLIGRDGQEELIAAEVARLQDLKDKKEIGHDDDLRLANLSGGISILKLGKLTEMGWEDLNYRVDDAIRATETAVKAGIIEGEYQGLLKAVKGYPLFEEIVCELMKTLALNSGADESVAKAMYEGRGYDFKNEKFVDDLYAAGIIDPVEVTRASLKNAVDISFVFLTTSGLIIDAEVLEIA